MNIAVKCWNELFHFHHCNNSPKKVQKCEKSSWYLEHAAHISRKIEFSSLIIQSLKCLTLRFVNIDFMAKLYAVKEWLTFCNVGMIWVELWHQGGIEHEYEDFPHAWRLLHTSHICVPDLLRSVVVHYGNNHPPLSHWDIRLRPLHNLKCNNKLASEINQNHTTN